MSEIDISPERIQKVCRFVQVHKYQPPDQCAEITATLRAQSARIAELEVAQSVEVKPLEWQEDKDAECWLAETAWGYYSVYYDGAHGWLCELDGHDDRWVKYPGDEDGFASPDDAKSAVQADCDRRILSALQPAPEVLATSGAEQRWIESMENACDCCGGSGHKDDMKPATVQQAALIKALEEIRELNTTGRDENGHKWANSDLIEQTIVSALALTSPH